MSESERNEVFEAMGREIARQLGTSMDEHVDSAEAKLEDDDLVGFGLVAMRDGDDGIETVSQRAIDPEIVHESNHDAEQVIDALHSALCRTWDEEVEDR